MLNRVKMVVRNALPRRHQVPIKYWYCVARDDIEPEMVLLDALVREGDHVLDVGGNRGIYAYRFRKLGARLDVFEPNPECAAILESWASAQRKVNIHQVALSSRSGLTQLHVPVDEHGVTHDASASIEHSPEGATQDHEVPLRPLDSFGFTDVALVKIDVEGHEGSVIAGAEATLRASMPALLIEIEQRHNSKPIHQIFEEIESFGYRGFFLIDGSLRSLREFDLEKHQSMKAFSDHSPSYHNNFLFLGEEKLRSGVYKSLTDRWFSGAVPA